MKKNCSSKKRSKKKPNRKLLTLAEIARLNPDVINENDYEAYWKAFELYQNTYNAFKHSFMEEFGSSIREVYTNGRVRTTGQCHLSETPSSCRIYDLIDYKRMDAAAPVSCAFINKVGNLGDIDSKDRGISMVTFFPERIDHFSVTVSTNSRATSKSLSVQMKKNADLETSSSTFHKKFHDIDAKEKTSLRVELLKTPFQKKCHMDDMKITTSDPSLASSAHRRLQKVNNLTIIAANTNSSSLRISPSSFNHFYENNQNESQRLEVSSYNAPFEGCNDWIESLFSKQNCDIANMNSSNFDTSPSQCQSNQKVVVTLLQDLQTYLTVNSKSSFNLTKNIAYTKSTYSTVSTPICSPSMPHIQSSDRYNPLPNRVFNMTDNELPYLVAWQSSKSFQDGGKIATTVPTPNQKCAETESEVSMYASNSQSISTYSVSTYNANVFKDMAGMSIDSLSQYCQRNFHDSGDAIQTKYIANRQLLNLVDSTMMYLPKGMYEIVDEDSKGLDKPNELSESIASIPCLPLRYFHDRGDITATYIQGLNVDSSIFQSSYTAKKDLLSLNGSKTRCFPKIDVSSRGLWINSIGKNGDIIVSLSSGSVIILPNEQLYKISNIDSLRPIVSYEEFYGRAKVIPSDVDNVLREIQNYLQVTNQRFYMYHVYQPESPTSELRNNRESTDGIARGLKDSKLGNRKLLQTIYTTWLILGWVGQLERHKI